MAIIIIDKFNGFNSMSIKFISVVLPQYTDSVTEDEREESIIFIIDITSIYNLHLLYNENY